MIEVGSVWNCIRDVYKGKIVVEVLTSAKYGDYILYRFGNQNGTGHIVHLKINF